MAKPRKKTQAKSKAKTRPKKISRTRKPEDLSLEAWQVALRKEYGRAQNFKMKNLGEDPLFSEFLVTNPERGSSYQVAVRGLALGENYCSCPDFAVNTLGTCKHIEWLLAKLKRKRGAKKRFEEGFQPCYSEVYLAYGLQREVRFRPGSECPPELRKAAHACFDTEGRMHEAGPKHFEPFMRKAIKSDHDVRIYQDAQAFVARLRDDAHRRKAIKKHFEGGDKAFKKLLSVNLYPYQRHGALFAAKAGRCLLADDMGLGKTIQSIAAVEMLIATMGIERILVVCPTALKHQWADEVARFSGREACVVSGLQQQRDALYAQPGCYKIVNYDVIHRDLAAINAWGPELVILDEAQRIKNWETRRAQSVKQLKSEYAFVLTGTPLENRLSELHSIMEFVDCFHLGPLFRFLHTHQHSDESGRVIGYKELDRIKESLAPVLVRRRKSEVLQELPQRVDKHLFVEMTREQQIFHAEAEEVVSRIVAKWRRFGFLSEQDRLRLMASLQRMRMACINTWLCDKETDHGPKIAECAILLSEVLEEAGVKAVVFSQWLGTHELLIRELDTAGLGHAFYHGGLSQKQRKAVIDGFKQDPERRVLLCTDSGGVGLNLQEASILINMDQPWNPAVLEQRIGRVHRLGQDRHVQVYHFVSENTIEHRMLNVLQFKSSLFEGVLDAGESEVFLNDGKMKRFMETVEAISESPKEAGAESIDEAAAAQLKAEADAVVGPEALCPQEAAPPPADPWSALLDSGLALLRDLGAAQAAQGQAASPGDLAACFVHTNEATGQAEVRVPLPSPESAQKLGALLSGFGALLQGLNENGK